MNTSTQLLDAAAQLSGQMDRLSFSEPVTHVYNPLDYAWSGYSQYVRRFAHGPKRVVWLGMNPGPWGMAQTGVPFGEVGLVRDWLGIQAEIKRPANEHPKRPVLGLDCPRSEVSGQRLWGLFKQRFKTAEAFFADQYVANYCPLMFMEISGRNRTPDKLPVSERRQLEALCQVHLQAVINTLNPAHLVAIGKFAETRIKTSLRAMEGHADPPTSAGPRPPTPRLTRVLHPSPASPAANRGWPDEVERTLTKAEVW